MKKKFLIKLSVFICLNWVLITSVGAYEYVSTPEGVHGHTDTPKLPWCNYVKHDMNRPLPLHVDTGTTLVSTAPPSDAVVLFDGKNLSAWNPGNWKLSDGVMIAGGGYLVTRQSFGDCQFHLEFMVPNEPSHRLDDRGNSGVLFMGLYEIQIFDSHPIHKKQVYPDGQCAAVYGETPPMLNACRLPGQWQSFDIIFTAPVFKGDKLLTPASVTMLHNGVLVHLNTIIHGPVAWRGILQYKSHPGKLPLKIQSHGSSVRFRNIWIRQLDQEL